MRWNQAVGLVVLVVITALGVSMTVGRAAGRDAGFLEAKALCRNATMSLRATTEETIPVSEASLPLCPVGSILPYVGDIERVLPAHDDPASRRNDHWVICNGDPWPMGTEEGLRRRFGDTTPNLMSPGGMFLAGVWPYEPSRTGGRADIPLSSDHDHQLDPGHRFHALRVRAGTVTDRAALQTHWLSQSNRKLRKLSDTRTSMAAGHDHGGENRPPFHPVVYIIRYR